MRDTERLLEGETKDRKSESECASQPLCERERETEREECICKRRERQEGLCGFESD